MRNCYVKLGLVLVGVTLVMDMMACTPAGVEGEAGQEDTVVAQKDEDPSALSGEYVIETENESGVLKVFGPTPSEEIVFSLVMTTQSGCTIERTGRAQMLERNKAVYNQVNTNCSLEFDFAGQQVRVVQNNCPERDTVSCTFDGTYVLSVQQEASIEE